MATAHGKRRRGRVGYASRIVALGLLALFVALLAYGLLSKPADTTIDTSLSEGRAPPAPDFELEVLQRGASAPALAGTMRPALSDGRLALRELRGAPVVLNFWASWCPPCREEAPRLEQAWRSGRARGVLVVGLDMQDLTGDAHDFIREFRISYPNVRDPGDDIAREWGVTGLPETFFISARGRVVSHVVGAISQGQLDDGVRAARAGRPLAPRQGGERRSTR